MTRLAISIIALATSAALMSCLKAPTFQCDEHGADSCGAGATCESSGFCSRPAPECDGTGRRYVDSAGDLAGQCVGADQTTGDPDAGPDAGGGVDADAGPEPVASTCVFGPAQSSDNSCAAAVCERAPACCTTMWTRECVVLSEIVCARSCSNAVATGSLNRVGVGVATPSWHSVMLRAMSDWAGIAWGDFDGDGDTDLAYSEECAVRILRNQGVRDGLLEMDLAGTITPSSCAGQKLAWGDADGDGDLDLAHGSLEGLAIIINRGDGFDDPVELLDATHEVSTLAFDDYNGDGKADLVAGLWGARARLFRGQNGGQSLVSAWDGPEQARRFRWCHLGQGEAPRPALIAIGPHDLLSVYPNTGSPSPTPRFSVDVPGELQDVACGDLDGDGTAEIVTVARYENANESGYVRVHSVTDGAVLWTAPMAYHSDHLDVGDVDGDGLIDIVVDTDPPGSDINVPEPFRVFRQQAGDGWQFVDEVGGDWGAGSDTSDLQVIHLDLE